MQSLFIFRESTGRIRATRPVYASPSSLLLAPYQPSKHVVSALKASEIHERARGSAGVSRTGQLFCCHSDEISGSLGKRFRFSPLLHACERRTTPWLTPSSFFFLFHTAGNCSSAQGWIRYTSDRLLYPLAYYASSRLYLRIKQPLGWIRRSMNSMLRRRVINSRFQPRGPTRVATETCRTRGGSFLYVWSGSSSFLNFVISFHQTPQGELKMGRIFISLYLLNTFLYCWRKFFIF